MTAACARAVQLDKQSKPTQELLRRASIVRAAVFVVLFCFSTVVRTCFSLLRCTSLPKALAFATPDATGDVMLLLRCRRRGCSGAHAHGPDALQSHGRAVLHAVAGAGRRVAAAHARSGGRAAAGAARAQLGTSARQARRVRPAPDALAEPAVRSCERASLPPCDLRADVRHAVQGLAEELLPAGGDSSAVAGGPDPDSIHFDESVRLQNQSSVLPWDGLPTDNILTHTGALLQAPFREGLPMRWW
jgi:hypothetical protein